jgi:hypothetical protein
MRAESGGTHVGDEDDEQVETERDEYVPNGVKLGIRNSDARERATHEATKRDVHEPKLDREDVRAHPESKETTHARAFARSIQEVHAK